MISGVLAIAAGGFLLGGAYSVARLERRGGRQAVTQLGAAAVLLALAVYLIVVGIAGLAQG